jgi:hypothetical protein
MTLIADKPKRQSKKKSPIVHFLETLERSATKVPQKAWDSVPRDGSTKVNQQGMGEF